MDPEAFVHRPAEGENAEYGDAVLYGYQQMDGLLADFIALAGDDVTLVLASALSQQPYLKNEHIGGQRFARPRDVDGLLRMLGVTYERVFPVMTHQFLVHFATDALRDEARRRLEDVTWDGQPVFGFSTPQPRALYFGNQIKVQVPDTARIRWAGRDARYYDVFYTIAEIKSGCHHPDGILWFRTGRHARHPEKVSILDVLPTILGHFGVDVPAAEPRIGRDLRLAFA
jgi:hypothetical protein